MKGFQHFILLKDYSTQHELSHPSETQFRNESLYLGHVLYVQMWSGVLIYTTYFKMFLMFTNKLDDSNYFIIV